LASIDSTTERPVEGERETAARPWDPGSAGARRLLLFVIGSRLCAIEIDVVREIIPFRAATRLPGAAPSVCGLINLRGTIVTVLDLGLRVGGVAVDHREGSIVLVEYGSKIVGLGVDEVRDVQLLTENDLGPAGAHAASALGTEGEDAGNAGRTAGIVRALAHVNNEVVILLDVHAIVRDVLL
jgi:purine-binding chemotaxis protein CheW